MTPTPSDENVSPDAVATPTRVDNIAEKMFAAIEGVTQDEAPIDVIAALSVVTSRYQHVINEKIDADQLGAQS